MSMSSAHLRQTLERPPAPAAIRWPNAGRPPPIIRRAPPLPSYPPLAWYYTIDPMVLFLILLFGAVATFVVGWLVGFFP